jgi:hypothetical protein
MVLTLYDMDRMTEQRAAPSSSASNRPSGASDLAAAAMRRIEDVSGDSGVVVTVTYLGDAR